MVSLDGNSLTLQEVIRVARSGEEAVLRPAGEEQIRRSRKIVDRILEEERPVYGISTGFGDFSKVFIEKDKRAQLQRNLILSHATGVGEHLPADVVRAAMLLRANSLAKGYSGIRLETVQMLLTLLNRQVTPASPCKGSVGASGDLAPLSHMVLVMLGEGEAYVEGKLVSGAEALKRVGLQPIVLSGKEGLALINGTQIMTAVGCIVWQDAVNLMKAADIAAALSVEGLKGTRAAFDRRISEVRQHPGQLATAENMLALTADSAIIASVSRPERMRSAFTALERTPIEP